MEIRDDLETLLEPFLKKELAGECEEFFLRSRNEEIEDMLPGFLSLSKMVLRSRATSSLKEDFVGESEATGAGACCNNFESKYCRDSSKESDFGRGMDPLTMVVSIPAAISREWRKSIASLTPPALLRVKDHISVTVGPPSSVRSLSSCLILTSTTYCAFSCGTRLVRNSSDSRYSMSLGELERTSSWLSGTMP